MEGILSEIECLGYHMTVKSDYVTVFAKDIGEIFQVHVYATGAIMVSYYHNFDPNTSHPTSLSIEEIDVFMRYARYAKIWLKR